MKKQFLLYASLALSSVSFAQQQTRFTVKAGISRAGLRGDAMGSLGDLTDLTGGMVKNTDRTGIFAGGSVSVPVAKNFSIEPGIYYSQKGSLLKGELDGKALSFLGANAKAQLNSHYIDVPLLAKAGFGGFEVFAGPQLSWLARADLKVSAGALGFDVYKSSYDATDQLNRWDAGITGGIGYRFSNGLGISASYDHGLTRADANRNIDSYNKAVKVGIGFSF
ncbi:MAG TPA: porin family protein [Chitinophagaceae bacterium]